MADINLKEFYDAIREGARQATLEALAGNDFATSANQDLAKGVLDTISGALDVDLSTRASESTLRSSRPPPGR